MQFHLLSQAESGLVCDKGAIPAICKSDIFLNYQIKSILKDENTNSFQMALELSNFQFLPFPVEMEHFDPISSYITLEITTDEKTGNKVSIYNLMLKSIGQTTNLH